jgi:hypothetical protein
VRVGPRKSVLWARSKNSGPGALYTFNFIEPERKAMLERDEEIKNESEVWPTSYAFHRNDKKVKDRIIELIQRATGDL